MHYSSVFPKLVKLLLYPFITYLLLSLSLSLSLTYQISKNTSFFFPFFSLCVQIQARWKDTLLFN